MSRARHGRIDILVASAGIAGSNGKVVDYPVAEFHKVVEVNLFGVFHSCKAILPFMERQGYGRVVNIASVAGKEGNPNAGAYSASKAAVMALTKTLGKEHAGTDIAVNCVTPAAARTRIFDQLSQSHIDFMLSKIPRGRFLRGGRGGLHDRVALHEGELLHDGRGVRPVGRARDLLTGLAPPGERGPRSLREGRPC